MYSHARSTPRHFPPLPHTVELPRPVRVGLALHVVIVESLAAVADEEAGAQEWRGRRPNFLDLGYVRGHGRRVEEHRLIESGRKLVDGDGSRGRH